MSTPMVKKDSSFIFTSYSLKVPEKGYYPNDQNKSKYIEKNICVEAFFQKDPPCEKELCIHFPISWKISQYHYSNSLLFKKSFPFIFFYRFDKVLHI